MLRSATIIHMMLLCSSLLLKINRLIAQNDHGDFRTKNAITSQKFAKSSHKLQIRSKNVYTIYKR